MITFTNSKGVSITITNIKPYTLLDIEGTGGVDSDVQMQKAPYQDGQTYIDSILESRNLSIDVGILGTDVNDIYTKRNFISNVFNPKLGEGIIRFDYAGVVREIEVIPDTAPVFLSGKNNSTQKFQRVQLNLVAPNPFWLSITEDSGPMSAWIGGFSFPLTLGTKFSTRGTKQVFTNNGDVETPVIIEFNGPATNPKVENLTTGEFILVKKELLSTDKLIIHTAFGKKRVEIEDSNGNKTNAFNWIDLDSSFWSLIPGDNTIKYSAEAGTEDATVKITWRNRYVGV